MEENLDQISAILPSDFFHASADLYKVDLKKPLKKKNLLPDLSSLLWEDPFAQVSMGYEEKGLLFEINVEKPFEECFFPHYRKGDSVELMLDTRDGKNAGFPTKFCHHFVILPTKVEDVLAQEMTHFRSEDRHELCDPDKILVTADFRKKAYSLKIFLSEDCLYGYDPKAFRRLGFAYRINRFDGYPQHFSMSSSHINLDQQPSLWATLNLK